MQRSSFLTPDVLWKKSLSLGKKIRQLVLSRTLMCYCFFLSLSELKKVHIEVKETAATQPTRKAPAPAEQENGSEEEDDEDGDDEEEDDEDESEEEEEDEEKDSQTAKEKNGKEESSESSSESDSDDERTKEERMYDKAKKRIEVQAQKNVTMTTKTWHGGTSGKTKC